MSKIKVLDNLTIQKIAAGEVVERPSSIVKELLENSLDANSNNITIEIQNGGKTYIRITDDGEGINEDDLELAFERHSTSKLSTVEDLYTIRSLGFRGEALSSISNVARVEIMTKTEDSMGGIQAIVEEGKVIEKNVIGSPKGTTMIIRDLFYNLPVRKKFLKSDLVESNQISDIVYKIVLGNLGTSFKFIKDNKIILKTSRNNDLSSHIYSILGKEFSKNLVEANFEKYGIIVKGLISNNNLYRSNRSHQYIYINGRYINNTSISSAIESQFKSIIPLNRFPVFILFVEMDPSIIDVNIHPTKQEIKFANQDEIIEVINKAIENSLYSSITIPKVNFSKKENKKEDNSLPLLFEFTTQVEEKLEEDNFKPSNFDIEQEIVVKDLTEQKEFIPNSNNIYINETENKEKYFPKAKDLNIDNEKTNENYLNNKSTIKDTLTSIEPMGVIFSTYILAEDRVNEKFYFIDQHAAHERVMYEKYLNEYEKENIATQQILIPEIIELTNTEMSNFLEGISVFINLGFDLEQFGNNSIIIRGVPLIFGKPNIKDLFYDLLDNIQREITSSYDIRVEKIMKIACTNAIKSGDNISNLEIYSLFDQLKKCKDPHSCPHGRPTILEMTKKDIEKEFLRIT
jgi:DNA mismatch repair protein MutL